MLPWRTTILGNATSPNSSFLLGLGQVSVGTQRPIIFPLLFVLCSATSAYVVWACRCLSRMKTAVARLLAPEGLEEMSRFGLIPNICTLVPARLRLFTTDSKNIFSKSVSQFCQFFRLYR